MNPLNSQHQSQTQLFITTGMPPLAPASANSILKPATTAPSTIATLSTNHNLSAVNCPQTVNHLLDANNFIASTSFLPVLLTNQSLMTKVEQQQQQQMQKVPPTLINVVNSPVVSSSNMPTFMTSTKQQPMVITSTPGGNITYQVMTSQPNPNMGPAVLTTAQNGAVSVLLTSSSPTTMAATSGHVAAPSLIIRNTPTAAALAAAPNASGGAGALTQINKPPQQQIKQQQYQQQFHQQLLSHSLNTQQLNPEILKQIVVGNINSTTSNSTSGKTFLKPPSLLKNKPSLSGVQKQHPAANKTINKTKMTTAQQQPTQQQQHKLKTSQAISGKSGDSSTKLIAALGMELLKASLSSTSSSSSQSNNKNVNANVITQTVQKLPQVSLLQNSKAKSSLNTTTASGGITSADSITTSSVRSSVKSNEKSKVLQNPNEVRVGNLNAEVSLIKKSTTLNEEKTKEKSSSKSLLKTMAASQEKQQHQQEVSLLKTNTKYENPSKLVKVSSGNNNILENKSKQNLKALSAHSKSNVSEILLPDNTMKSNSTFSETNANEKQESLLKSNKKNTENTPETTSPRNQRSKSCYSGLKSTQTSLLDCSNSNNNNNNNNTNGRRHSEPIELETVMNNNNSLDLKTSSEIDKLAENCLKSKEKVTETKKPSRFDKLDVDSLKSEELDALLEEFEDEEYLESSGEKSEVISPEIPIQTQEQTKNEEIIVSKTASRQIQKDSNVDKNVNSLLTTQNIELEIQEQTKQINYESGSDDDVTILPMDDASVVPIEIEDDDDEDEEEKEEEQEKATVISSTNSPSSSQEKEKHNDLLLCDEQILISSSSSISNHSSSSSVLQQKSPKSNLTAQGGTTTTSPLLKKSLTERKINPIHVKEEPINGNSSVVDMLSNYNMLNWRERIGMARGTQLKFQLNEFNLIQVHEKIPNRTKCSYEKPVYERDNLQIRTEANEPIIYYMCRRCNVRASAVDFLAPEFCSLYCLRRDRRKRQTRAEENPCILRKKQRSIITNNNNPPPLAYITQPKFRWSSYLKANFTSIAAPISLFLNPFPTGPNNFRIGMKLEAIDPENCSLFCVCTVVDINGYRLKLSFDGYDSSYDFWLNADSMDIFPPGWCAKTNRILQPPKGISASKFNWGSHLSKEKATAAPRHLFTHLNSSSLIPRNQFEIGMHLEAEDLNDTGKLCVASIADVLDDRIRIHFDGWDDCYDIIVDINSPYIHPCGWHEGRQHLVIPPDCENSTFNWAYYIRKQGTGVAAGDEIFVPREPINFRSNMKLEVVDPRNSSLIRPATVVSHKGHRVKLHLDGWPHDYCFWLEDDSPDLHPIGWSDATGHDLEPPPGFQMAAQKMPCPIDGCRGIGNAKKSFMTVHASRDCCPYAPENWRIVMEKSPRLGYDDITRTLSRQNKHTTQQQQNHGRLSDQEILERLEMLDNIKTRNLLMQQDKVVTSPKDLIGFSSLSKVKRERNKFDATALSASSTSTSSSSCKVEDDEPIDVNIEIAKEFLCDYGPRLQQCYTLWQKNLSFDDETIKHNPMTWLVSDVVAFVEQHLKNSETANLFAQEDIDGQAFLLLQQEDLTERLGLKLGPAVKVYTCILQLRTLAVTKFNVAHRKVSKK